MNTLALVLALVALAVSIATALGVVMIRDARHAPIGCDRCCGCDPECDHASQREHL